jgi:hypothetical protein
MNIIGLSIILIEKEWPLLYISAGSARNLRYVGRQRTGIRRQRTEDRKQRTEVREQRVSIVDSKRMEPIPIKVVAL